MDFDHLVTDFFVIIYDFSCNGNFINV